MTWPLSHVEGALAHCADCRKQFPISDLVLADAVKQGLRSLVVEPIGFLLNPIGVLSKRHPHVAERIERLHRHSAGMLPDKTSPTAG